MYSGFYHEHTRPDRDNFVTVNWDKFNQSFQEDFLPPRLYSKKAINFKICSGCRKFGEYDYGSVMHYGRTIGIQNREVLTVNNDKCDNCEIGQRKGLSEQDVADIHKLYGCSKLCLSDCNIRLNP